MKKEITIKEFEVELEKRINEQKTIECCKAEIINLAKIAAENIGEKLIEVEWVD